MVRQWWQTGEAGAAMVRQWWQTGEAGAAMVRQWWRGRSGHVKTVVANTQEHHPLVMWKVFSVC